MINKVIPNTVFIYLTEKCNLSCDYCYFRDKRNRTLTFSTVKNFLDYFKSNPPKYFEISGGEPLIFWPLVKKIVAYLHRFFDNAEVGIQTNGLFLDKDKISFIKANNLTLEIGLDGDYDSTSAHREDIDRRRFDILIDDVCNCIKEGIDLSCTMTIHPHEVEKLVKNFIFLKNLGLKSIDVTPAAFMQWSRESITTFKKNYYEIIKDKSNRERIFADEDIIFLDKFTLDFSLHPPGYVFCGDAYLCLPEAARKKFSVLDFDASRPFNRKIFSFYIEQYEKYLNKLKRKVTYRDYVSASFKIISLLTSERYLNVEEMIDFHNFLKKVHLQHMRG